MDLGTYVISCSLVNGVYDHAMTKRLVFLPAMGGNVYHSARLSRQVHCQRRQISRPEHVSAQVGMERASMLFLLRSLDE